MKKGMVIILSGLLVLLVIAGAFAFLLPPKSAAPAPIEDVLELDSAPPPTPTASPTPSGAAPLPTAPPTPRPSAPIVTFPPKEMETPTPATPAPAEETSIPQAENTPKPSAALTATPDATPTPEATREPSVSGKPLAGLVIGVDPGHQNKSNKELEPVAPGSSELKKKVSSGTQGIYTRVPEHEVVLSVGLHLQKLLKEAGATVVMTRETGDVNISNVERAQLFNKKKVDLGIRLHINGSTDQSVRGAFMLVPRDKNYPYYEENVRAAKRILEAYGKATGIGTKKGITYRADQTGFNWCERPIINIEMGHMTNKEEDLLLTDKDFQKKMAQGIFNGIVAYFS